MASRKPVVPARRRARVGLWAGWPSLRTTRCKCGQVAVRSAPEPHRNKVTLYPRAKSMGQIEAGVVTVPPKGLASWRGPVRLVQAPVGRGDDAAGVRGEALRCSRLSGSSKTNPRLAQSCG